MVEAERAPVLRKSGNLLMRVMSGLVLGPIFLIAIWFGGWPFVLLIILSCAVAIGEWLHLIDRVRALPPTLLAAAGLGLSAAIDLLYGAAPGFAVLIGVSLLFAIGWRLLKLTHPILAALGLLYVGGAALSVVWLRDQEPEGRLLTLFLFMVVWVNDTAAYGVGRWLKGARLLAVVSPSKTWSGFIGGVIGGGLAALLLAWVFDFQMPLLALALGIGLAVISVGGDLMESSLKRRYKAKDSGDLIPGHGGMLDRIDGLIPAALLLALFHYLLGRDWSWL